MYITPTPSKKDVEVLKRKLSYVRKNARHMPNPKWAIVNLYDSKQHRFPIGLAHRVEKIIWVKNKPKPVMSTDASYGDLRPYQNDACNTMFNNLNGIIKIPTGGGKTKVALEFLKYKEQTALILVPTIDLVKQWKAQTPPWVHVKTYAAIKNKKYVQQFDIVIFDECHHCAAKTLYKIGMNVSEDALLFGLSATPLNRDDDNLKVEAVLGPIIYEISTRELIDQGYLCDAKVHYHCVDPMDSEGFVTYPMMYDEYVTKNDVRNDKIIGLAENSKKPCLILINRIEHGEILLDHIESNLSDVTFIHGNSKKEHREDVDHDIIIATSIYDEGVDLPNLQTLIIGAGGKSAIKAVQRVGRLLRPFPNKAFAVIHDFKDSCRWLDKHYLARRRIFEKDFEVIDVEE